MIFQRKIVFTFTYIHRTIEKNSTIIRLLCIKLASLNCLKRFIANHNIYLDNGITSENEIKLSRYKMNTKIIEKFIFN